jgi:hypothetical protein
LDSSSEDAEDESSDDFTVIKSRGSRKRRMEDCQQSSDAEKQRKRRAPGKWRPYQSNRPKRTFKEDPQNICFSSAKSTVNGIRMQQMLLDHFRG